VSKALGKMWTEEGWRGFMRGNGTNCIRIVPYSAVQFGSYNLYRKVSSPAISPIVGIFLGIVNFPLMLLQHFFEREPGTIMNPFQRLCCGGIAGVTSVFFTYPLDIVRTRLSIQTASFAALGEVPKDKPAGMWTTMVLMYRNEGGVLALYRGIVPTVAGVAPYVGFPPLGSPTRK
jgi:solute carrier family 25 phosphate transporter 23/24/25/41